MAEIEAACLCVWFCWSFTSDMLGRLILCVDRHDYDLGDGGVGWWLKLKASGYLCYPPPASPSFYTSGSPVFAAHFYGLVPIISRAPSPVWHYWH